jgi:hypothetical protein
MDKAIVFVLFPLDRQFGVRKAILAATAPGNRHFSFG